MNRYENLCYGVFEGVGKYDIPIIEPIKYDSCEFIGFNYAKTCKSREDKGIHFFLDDYQFERLWNRPEVYLQMLQQFRYVMTPDFSTFTDFPKALQIWNHYKKHWLGAYLQERGVNIIPTISWSDKESLEWCFDGEPVNSVVAISSVGTQKNKVAKEKFLLGYEEMVKRLQPETIIFYGNVPEECKGNIVKIRAFQEKFREAKCNGW